ncbi:MAG TPA: hypothetical protein VFQ61_05125, partial [Polyangiaceae bacterium]|nr:hypothetical protein [Polyangiaceae bacterium]
ENVADQPALHSTAEQLREHALRGAELSLRALSQLQNRPDLQPAFANMKSYGFHVALFDWAYRNSCDPRFLDAVFALADEIASPAGRGGLQITSADQPNHGAYLLSRAAREQGASRLDDQGIKLWALRIAYERRRKPEYVRSAALFMDAWLQQRAEDRLFSGMVRQFDRYLPAGLGEERSPAGHYAILVGLKAWADRLPRARQLYERGFEYTSARADVRRVGYLGPYRMLSRSDGLADFGGEAELGAMLLWAMTGDTHGKSGSKTCTRSVRAPALTDDTRVGAH